MSEVTVLVETDGTDTKVVDVGLSPSARESDRSLALWRPSMGSMDQIVKRTKPLGDARGRDMALNDGYAKGAVATHKDSIVGGHYRLNAQPVLRVLQTQNKAFDETWATEFQEVVEARFNLLAESEEGFLDAEGKNTLTGLIRLAVGGFMLGGEVLAVGEWDGRDRTRPLKTCLQMVAPLRLSNPNGEPDTKFLRNGVVVNARGKPTGYWIRKSHPGDAYDLRSFEWTLVDARKPWGRQQVIHIVEQMEPGQTRGIADMVAALKHMKMTSHLSEQTLQSAVVNASYAASIESELPPDAVYGAMGGQDATENFESAVGAYLSLLGTYFDAANNITIDGTRVPILPPGTKFQARALGTPGGVGTDFEESLHRHTAAALGLSYEEFSRNFKGVSYSGGKLAVAVTGRFMASRKKMVADRFANAAYALVLEEEFGNGNVPLPVGVDREFFYLPLMKQALCGASWIGASSGQVDELKETQAAILRIKSGLSTYEAEAAKLGRDWRELFAQRAREEGLIAQLGVPVSLETAKSGQNGSSQPKDQSDNAQGAQAGEEEE